MEMDISRYRVLEIEIITRILLNFDIWGYCNKNIQMIVA